MALLKRKISTREMVPLCRQLATSYDAGIPILKGLQLVERGATSATTRNLLRTMREEIQSGSTLADAARARREQLPEFFVELLASGERGGKLDAMLRDLADYYEDRLKFNRAIVGAMAYPVFLLTAAWFLGSFSIGLVSRISFDARSAFSLGDYLDQWLRFQGVALLIAAAVLAGLWALGRTGLPQRALGLLSTRLWPFSQVTRKYALSRFFRSFALLVGAGVNIKHCIHQAALTAGNPVIRDDLLRALPVVAQGGTLQEAFARCATLTPVSREMLAVGEATGNLEFQMRKVSEYHFEEAQLATKVALRLLNILLILVVGGVVGATVIGFYAKLFSLGDSI